MADSLETHFERLPVSFFSLVSSIERSWDLGLAHRQGRLEVHDYDSNLYEATTAFLASMYYVNASSWNASLQNERIAQQGDRGFERWPKVTRSNWNIKLLLFDVRILHYTNNMASASPSSSSRTPDTGPLLGSAYLTSQSLIPPASPSELNASLCLNISLFKNTLKKYRALDDAITTRLNRDQALHREHGGNTEEGQKQNCLRIWRDIIGEARRSSKSHNNADWLQCSSESWKRREAVIRYCVSSVDDRLAEREKELRKATSPDTRDYDRLNADRKEREIRDDLYSEQTKVGVLELSRNSPLVDSLCVDDSYHTNIQREQLHNELSG